MIKLIVYLKRATGLTREQFIAYYETYHVPLICSLLKMGHVYRRNYINAAQGFAAAPDFDVITEVWFRDAESWDAFLESLHRPGVAEQIVADEKKFIDRDSMRASLADVAESDMSQAS